MNNYINVGVLDRNTQLSLLTAAAVIFAGNKSVTEIFEYFTQSNVVGRAETWGRCADKCRRAQPFVPDLGGTFSDDVVIILQAAENFRLYKTGFEAAANHLKVTTGKSAPSGGELHMGF